MLIKKHQYWAFVLPALLFIILIIALPFLIGIYYSFTDSNGLNSSFIGLKNYQILFRDTIFLQSLWLTVKFSVVSVLLINLIGLAFALIVTSSDNRFNKALRTIFFMPNLIGGILLGFIWQFIFTSAFKALGGSLNLDFFNGWLSDPATGFWGIVILFVWQMSGYIMLIYVSFLNSIPQNTIQAARLDGAERWQILMFIKLPQLAPAFTISLFLTLANSFKLYEQNLALTNGGPYRSTEMISMYIYNTAFVNFQQGYAQAAGIILFFCVTLVSFLQLALSRRGER
ncbi:carbohydrate ABC transporter permease [Liquorilactobacillus capillatus]|uniref:ABC-type sugar transport system, permease component n=1 Tax=Liquorilactobacillus capillatus DSM 19910 TaxID=1423731 RepID=A0A0R1ME86_9LACO|nr:sugar ABC transporter permease [Liquorilactobacillus capillatus]KRL03573.1 ABC-type sugar transport system, permease component [Liquorilactobacillus capillatus DSM 19910]